MRIYHTGLQVRTQPRHTMIVSPAADMPGQEVPREWVDEDNNPVDLRVEFAFGIAEVPDDLGRYVVSRGLAQKTRLILPPTAKVA